jgi:hypothetical protein
MFKVRFDKVDTKEWDELDRHLDYIEDCLNLPGWENTKADINQLIIYKVATLKKIRLVVDKMRW